MKSDSEDDYAAIETVPYANALIFDDININMDFTIPANGIFTYTIKTAFNEKNVELIGGITVRLCRGEEAFSETRAIKRNADVFKYKNGMFDDKSTHLEDFYSDTLQNYCILKVEDVSEKTGVELPGLDLIDIYDIVEEILKNKTLKNAYKGNGTCHGNSFVWDILKKDNGFFYYFPEKEYIYSETIEISR